MFKKLTERQALNDAFEIYKESARTGESDRQEVIERLYKEGVISKNYRSGCPLCEYYQCEECPLKLEFGHCLNPISPFRMWVNADNDEDRKVEATKLRNVIGWVQCSRLVNSVDEEEPSSFKGVLWLASAIVTGFLIAAIVAVYLGWA